MPRSATSIHLPRPRSRPSRDPAVRGGAVLAPVRLRAAAAPNLASLVRVVPRQRPACSIHSTMLTPLKRVSYTLSRFVYPGYTRAFRMTEAHRIYREMKQQIVTCKLAPGLSISELEMCAQFQGSRTPVREACRRLCNESLMQMVPFRGYTIPPLTIEEYRNLYELQTVVEPAVAALAAERATPEQLREISELATYEYHAGQKNSYYTFLECNKNFHIAIAAATRNQALLDIVSNAQMRLMRYYYQVIVMDSYGATLVDEHRELVRALQSRKPELARARATDHLNKTVERSQKLDLRSANLAGDPTSAPFAHSVWLAPQPGPGTPAPKRLRTRHARSLGQA
jgi:DNA-binding GntR family transcriptional regulator